MMQPTLQSKPDTIMQRFRRRYWTLAVVFTLLASLIVAWFWSQPTPYANGMELRFTLPVLLLSCLAVNLVSSFFQDRYVRRVLRAPDAAARP